MSSRVYIQAHIYTHLNLLKSGAEGSKTCYNVTRPRPINFLLVKLIDS